MLQEEAPHVETAGNPPSHRRARESEKLHRTSLRQVIKAKRRRFHVTIYSSKPVLELLASLHLAPRLAIRIMTI